MTTGGYALLDAPRPKQRLIHIHSGAEELGRVYQADMMINSGMPQMTAALADMAPVSNPAWQQSLAQARAEFNAWQQEPPIFKNGPSRLNLWQVVQTLQATLPADTILTNGAGNFATWAHRFWLYGDKSSGLRTQLAPTSGAMGYGVPAGVAAKIVTQHQGEKRTVLTLAGDGDFMMTGQELATAVQYQAGVLFIVFNNSMFGTIRMHQERHYPARVSGTELRNPDFAALARAYGAHGEMVDTTGAFADALQRAQSHIQATGMPALIELRYDGNLITPNATLDMIRQTAQTASRAQ
jgi:acetolactate synthase-1/2/3 large subunit